MSSAGLQVSFGVVDPGEVVSDAELFGRLVQEYSEGPNSKEMDKFRWSVVGKESLQSYVSLWALLSTDGQPLSHVRADI